MSHAAVVSRDTDRVQQLGRAMLEKAKTCFSDTTFMREGGDPAEEAHQTKRRKPGRDWIRWRPVHVVAIV